MNHESVYVNGKKEACVNNPEINKFKELFILATKNSKKMTKSHSKKKILTSFFY